MADPRFFKNAGPFRLGELAELTGAELSKNADANASFSDVSPIDTATREDVSFLDNPKYIAAFGQSHAGACFVHPKHADKAPAGMALLLTEKPYLAYAHAATHFYGAPTARAGISTRANIDPTATIGEGCQVQAGAFVDAHCIVGANCVIGANAVLNEGVTIGDNSRIGANATLSHTMVGKNVILHPSVNIGQDGFGFAASEHGAVKVPQLGRVLIEDDVEIGAGTCIDRGAGPDTIIGMGSKIDNLVQIGHNVRLGRSVIIVSQVGISGSTEIGDGTTIAGQVGIAGHVRVGRGATIAAKAGVSNNVPDGAIYGGYPAVPVLEWRKQVATLSRLTKKKGQGQ